LIKKYIPEISQLVHQVGILDSFFFLWRVGAWTGISYFFLWKVHEHVYFMLGQGQIMNTKDTYFIFYYCTFFSPIPSQNGGQKIGVLTVKEVYIWSSEPGFWNQKSNSKWFYGLYGGVISYLNTLNYDIILGGDSPMGEHLIFRDVLRVILWLPARPSVRAMFIIWDTHFYNPG